MAALQRRERALRDARRILRKQIRTPALYG
jgi:hypothetical protein